MKAKADADNAYAAAQLEVAKTTANLADAKRELADQVANGEKELREKLKQLTSTKA